MLYECPRGTAKTAAAGAFSSEWSRAASGAVRRAVLTVKLGSYWRVGATGMCFAVFGLGGLALRFVAFPLLSLVERTPGAQRRRAREMLHLSMRLFVWLMTVAGTMSSEVRGRERLANRGQLVLANHPSLIDVVLLMALVRNANCVVKGSLFHNPFTRGPVTMAGYLCNSGGPSLVANAIESLRDGSNLLLFPEGTRTPLRGALHMQRGAANIAVRGRINIRPVVIRCSPPVLGKGMKWWQVPPRRAHFVIDVCEEIAIQRFLDHGANETVAVRKVTQHLHEYFSGELRRVNA
jgi:1-acyl-sn-glycerol-3-phosphate acyltransferase